MSFPRHTALMLTVCSAAVALATAVGAEPTPPPAKKRLLLVTHSGGFVHDSVGVAEEILKDIGPANGFDVTCYRFTGDPSNAAAFEKYKAAFRKATGATVGPENCGRVNKDTLKNFDCVLFFTTGNVLTKGELADLTEWVRDGGAFAGTHCATDTLHNQPAYGDLIGGYFKNHPAGLQKVKLKVEDPKHPAAAPFADGETFQDEVYIFKDAPYSRGKLHLLLSVARDAGFPPGKTDGRADGDYAISWCKEYGKGKVFYTSFGHPQANWRGKKFQDHLFGGLRWVTGQLPGDATPSK